MRLVDELGREPGGEQPLGCDLTAVDLPPRVLGADGRKVSSPADSRVKSSSKVTGAAMAADPSQRAGSDHQRSACDTPAMARDRHQLTTVVVGDEPGSWATAGFTVHDDRVRDRLDDDRV